MERKNLDLLKHIVSTSSNKSSIVIDFFCGSGTTLFAANELKRKWIGIDASSEAIKIAKEKLKNAEYGAVCVAYDKDIRLLA